MSKYGRNLKRVETESFSDIQEEGLSSYLQTNIITEQDLQAVQNIKLSELDSFHDHPFKVLDNDEMYALMDSISINGILIPIVVRKKSDGRYEIISGHRRAHAASNLKIDVIPAIVKDLSDTDAVLAMVDSNLQREHILPSEKAFSYKMRLDAVKEQKKSATTPLVQKLSVEQVGEEDDASRETVRRYIRLTNLTEDMLNLVDSELIKIRPAVELSYLTETQQELLFGKLDVNHPGLSMLKAERIRKFAQEGKLTAAVIDSIMDDSHEGIMRITIPADKVRRFFPVSYTKEQIEAEIIQLLEEKWEVR
ncbi:ParB/RepB/Spo0J family partition protein [Butyrivibrio sp. INlla16]|uniref:ParB/RepB/Spo0J family partition protein n=1 Tax=Butyrivibrio sp. INlla16 TaxID=1520807 RepID=UPI00088235D0|nr:ParB/RepB/Spo0J family partition protein [Butyrivibrio sp. INlla16]SDB62276.1 chromosome partitioning protein, ParB family [Butyrivibrio sp. INlla16]